MVYLSRDNVRPTAERKLTTAKQRNLDTTSTQQVTDAFASAKFHVRVPPAFTRWPTHQTNHVDGEDIRPSIDAHSMQVDPTVNGEHPRSHDRVESTADH